VAKELKKYSLLSLMTTPNTVKLQIRNKNLEMIAIEVNFYFLISEESALG
jgi:hypothetical protein